MKILFLVRYIVCITILGLCVNAQARTHKKHHKKTHQAAAGEFVNFTQWEEINSFIERMVEKHHFDKAQLTATFNKARYVESTIQQIKPAATGRTKNWQAYRARFIEPIRIRAGVAFWNTHADALARAEKQYGVPAYIIVGILGVETIYGRNTGNFRVIDALTTLAFNYPQTPNRINRMAFFQNELESTLLYARQFNIDPLSLQGSYAGAIGLPQFMPSSIINYGVDFDGDGKIDLRQSPVDAIGSIAHYLTMHGWKRDLPIIFPAEITATSEQTQWTSYLNEGLEATHTPSEISAAGITAKAVLPENIQLGLVDLQNGENPTQYWLGSANFFAVTKYNRSFFYAMSVIELGEQISKARSTTP